MDAVSRPDPGSIRVGEFLLDTRSGELRGESTRQVLSAQPFQVLLALVERPGELVTRDELRQRLWSADTYVDFEHGLNAVVKRLRDALGDAADAPRYIETVPRRGYRLVALVERGAPPAEPITRPHPEVVPPPTVTPAAPVVEATLPTAATSRPVMGWRRLGVTAALLAGAGLAIGLAGRAAYRGGPTQVLAGVPSGHAEPIRLTFGPGLQTDATWSPDGQRIAFAADRDGSFDLFVQQVRGGEPVRLTRTPADETEPAWSPDGRRLVFRSEEDGGGLWTIDPGGGPVRRLTRGGRRPMWMPGGRDVLYTANEFGQTLHVVRADGGEPPREILAGQLTGGLWSSVAVHPDGRIGVFGAHPSTPWGFHVLDPATGRLRTVDTTAALTRVWQHGPARLQWNADGSALFVEAVNAGVPAVWQVPVDPLTLAWRTPTRLTTGLSGAERAAVSPDGSRVAFTSSRSTTRAWLFPFDANRATPPGEGRPLTDEDATVSGLQVTADGSALYFAEERPGQAAHRGMRIDLRTGATTSVGDGVTPVPSPTGHLLAYTFRRAGPAPGTPEYAWAIRDAGGRERLMGPWSQGLVLPTDWRPDGEAVLATVMDRAHTGPGRLVEWTLGGGAAGPTPRVVVEARARQFWQGRYSPDGRWISFVAVTLEGSGALELGVVAARGSPHRAWTRIAADHAWPDKPRWSPDGRTIYFLSPQSNGYFNVWAAPVDPAAGRQTGAAVQVTRFHSPRWHVAPDIGSTEMGVAPGHLVLPMRSVTGSIWMIVTGGS